MATIVLSAKNKLDLGPVQHAATVDCMWDMLVRREFAYARICNLKFASGWNGNIVFRTFRTSQKIWAKAPMYGWGQGYVDFNVASWIRSHYTPDIVRSLIYHECGHVLAYTVEQDISYPPHKWLVDRLVGHWGPPPKAAAEHVATAVPVPPWWWLPLLKLLVWFLLKRKPQWEVVYPYDETSPNLIGQPYFDRTMTVTVRRHLGVQQPEIRLDDDYGLED